MNLRHPLPVAILGATGYVGRALATLLSTHTGFTLRALIGSSASAGRLFGDVWQEKEEKLQTHYGPIWHPKPLPTHLATQRISALSELDISGLFCVFSSVPDSASASEMRLVAQGVRVISHSPVGRLTHPLIIPELSKTVPTDMLIKMPNCVSIGLSLALAPLRACGITAIDATTFQSLSGQGDRVYPKEWAIGNVFPIGEIEQTETYIAKEVVRLLGVPKPKIRCYRVYVQEGHVIDVRVQLDAPISREAVIALWEAFPALPGHAKPLMVLTNPASPRSSSTWGTDMPVCIGNIAIDQNTLCFTVAIHNIIRGAAGNAILTAEWLSKTI